MNEINPSQISQRDTLNEKWHAATADTVASIAGIVHHHLELCSAFPRKEIQAVKPSDKHTSALAMSTPG